jgi:hypothetical protein
MGNKIHSYCVKATKYATETNFNLFIAFPDPKKPKVRHQEHVPIMNTMDVIGIRRMTGGHFGKWLTICKLGISSSGIWLFFNQQGSFNTNDMDASF